jgi:predicted ATP-grasp superfamily ATP-dependent carboligase
VVGVVVWREAERICSRLVEAFRLRGVFGVDLVWDGRRAWVIEVNPRPPGSLEAIELAGARGTLRGHVRAFDGELPRPGGDTVGDAGPAAAKAILYAASDIVVPDTGDWHRRGIRDIPRPRQRIAAGAPVCTLVAVSTTPQKAVDALRERAVRLQAKLSAVSESHAIA